MSTRTPYPSHLTWPRWARVSRFIPAPKRRGRPVKSERREILSALLYAARTGCQQPAMPRELPAGPIVYRDFMPWKSHGRLEPLHEELRGDQRRAEARQRQLSAATLDSQSVTTTEHRRPRGATPVRSSPQPSGTSSSRRSD